jgi:hypothetical protein
MSDQHQQGKRFICLLRQSDASDGTTSVEAQLAYLIKEGEQRGLVYVDKVALEGLTGSMPGKRHDLKELIRRKTEDKDFDVLLVQRIDRLTRSGPGHGFWFEHECTCAGISLLFVGDDIPEGRYSSLIKVAKYEAAFEQAFSTSQRSSQGMQFALEEGRVITCTHTPFGCWRLYMTADGTPAHIIRDLGDGRQEKLHPQTYEVIDRYGTIGGGAKGHYRKQKSEKVLLVPGDPDKADHVREMFKLHFCDGWGGKRIASRLNERGILSPRGKLWSQRQVEIIYQQEAYTGRSVGNRFFTGIHHKRGRGNPVPLNRDPAELATAECMSPTLRPFEEWEIQLQPLMNDFLEPHIREKAMAEHEDIWLRQTDPARVPKPKNKHPASEYLLSNLLTCKQDGETLVGLPHGTKKHPMRSYRHRKGRRGYQKGSIFNRTIPAAPLEAAVLGIVGEIFGQLPDLRQHVTSFVTAQMQSSPIHKESLDDLRNRRDQVKKRTSLLLSSLDEETLDDIQEDIQRLRVERRSLDEQIALAEGAQKHQQRNPEEVVESVLNRIETMKEQLHILPSFLLRQLLSQILASIVCDMETKAVEITLALPSWVVWADKTGGPALCLEQSSESSASSKTHPPVSVHLGAATCQYALVKGRACFDCRRVKVAA